MRKQIFKPKKPKKINIKDGEITKFLWLPKILNGELRWLEVARWKYIEVDGMKIGDKWLPFEWEPDWRPNPGGTISELLENKKISMQQFQTMADNMALGINVNDLVNDKVEINEQIAYFLKLCFQVPETFWLNYAKMMKEYDESQKERISK